MRLYPPDVFRIAAAVVFASLNELLWIFEGMDRVRLLITKCLSLWKHAIDDLLEMII